MADAVAVARAMEAEFGIPGVVGFGVRGELAVVEVRTEAAEATVAVQGAHLVEWRPAARDAVLFVSRRTAWARGEAIRGGVPVIWPWFGPRTGVVNPAPEGAGKSGSHGFARTSEWQMLFAGMMGDEVHLQWGLGPTEASRAAGFDGFRLAYVMVIGRELRLRLTVANEGPGELRYEEALHTYLAVGDAERVEIEGLEGTEYLDKREGGARRREGDGPVRLTGWTDRVYVDTEGYVHGAGWRAPGGGGEGGVALDGGVESVGGGGGGAEGYGAGGLAADGVCGDGECGGGGGTAGGGAGAVDGGAACGAGVMAVVSWGGLGAGATAGSLLCSG